MLLSAFAVANAEPSATALEPQNLISKINRDVAIRFVHSQDESAGSKPAAPAVHLESVHMADEVVKQMQTRVETILAARQVAWSKARERLAAPTVGAGDQAVPLLNQETQHINDIEKNLTETKAELQHQRRIANLSLAAYTAQTHAHNATLAAAASKTQAALDVESAKAAANAEIVAKDALKAEEEHWRARHSGSGTIIM